jgi:hypothetical protein
MPQICTPELRVRCPTGGDDCLGDCVFRVCIKYDNIASSTNVTNLTVDFEARTDVPLVLAPDKLEKAHQACGGNFNNGRGFVEYEDENGRTHRLDNETFEREYRRVVGAMTDADRVEARRIAQKGHCSNWTEDEKKWYREHVLPSQGGGFNIKWECQKNEPRYGMSVTQLSPTGNPKIRRFRAQFKIEVTCHCGGQRNQAELTVDLRGP